MIIKTVNIEEELEKLTVMEGRTPETPDEEFENVFATLAAFDMGGVFTGSIVVIVRGNVIRSAMSLSIY